MAQFVPLEKERKAKFVPNPEVGDREVVTPDIQPVPGSKLGAAGETTAFAATGAFALPVAGYQGLYELAKGYMMGEEDPVSKAAAAVEATKDYYTKLPQSKGGKTLTKNLFQSPRMEKLSEYAGRAGEETLKYTGSPAQATGVHMLIEAIPTIFGGEAKFIANSTKIRGGGRSEIAPQAKPEAEEPDVFELPTSERARKRDFEKVNSILRDEKIDTTDRTRFFKSLSKIGERTQSQGFSESMRRVYNTVLKRRAVEEGIETRLWNNARAGKEAYLRRDDIVDFRASLDEVIQPYLGLEDMPKVKKMIDRLDESLEGMPAGSYGKISKLYEWRKAINHNMPSYKADPAQASAMVSMKKTLDTYLKNKLVTDMIKGDVDSIVRWRRAIDKSAEIRELFDDDDIVRIFSTKDVTPEELRKLVFNFNSVNAAPSARRTVQKIRDIVQDDSETMLALRQESLFNVVEPLIDESPDFARYAKNYEQFVKKNPGLVKELFTDNSLEAMRMLYVASKSANARQTLKEKFGKDLQEVGPVVLFGHGIAKAGLKVRVAKDVANQMFTVGDTPIKLEIMREFLGYDPTQSIFKTPAQKSAAILMAEDLSEEERKEREE